MISLTLVPKLNQLYAQVPFSWERGISTPAHNAAEGGAKASYHLSLPDRPASAADLTFDSKDDLLKAVPLAQQLFGGVELDLTNNHLHVDERTVPWHVVRVDKKTFIPWKEWVAANGSSDA